MGFVPKGTEGKFRLVINIRYVNEYLVKKKFKFEGLKDLSDLAEKGDHAVSFDLTSGYYHVELHPRTRTYNGFEKKGSYYFCNCMPFGLATAPWVFSKVMRELMIYWRKGGIIVLPYLDDFFFSKKGKQACLPAPMPKGRKGIFRRGARHQRAQVQLGSGPLPTATGLRRRHKRGQIPSPGRPMGGPTVQNGRDPRNPRGEGACQKAFKLDGHCDFHETGLGANHSTIHEAPLCLDKLGVLLELLGDSHGGSEGRAAFLAASATTTFRRGHLAPTERGVHSGGHGRKRLRVGRPHYDLTHGACKGKFIGVGGRAVLYLPGALGSLPVAAIHGALVQGEIRGVTSGCTKLVGDRKPGKPQAHHQ